MVAKTIDIDTLFATVGETGPHQLATIISEKYTEWNNNRIQWLREKHELRNYIFATDTSSTSNSSLPWKNSTTVPKLTQIRDNLHANYMASLFPNRKWLKWEGNTADDEEGAKRKAIEAYIQTKLVQDRAEVMLSQLLLDYIDWGNCFATVEWVDESRTNDDTGEVIRGYVGPRIVRIDPYDLIFNPMAATFQDTPKIQRCLKNLGEFAREIEDLPEGERKTKLKEVLGKSTGVRRSAAQLDPKDALKSDAIAVDGFGSYQIYLQSDYVEILTFYGTLYDISDGKLYNNRKIEIVDRAFILSDVPNPALTVNDMFHHAGWRQRQGNLYAMGPLDNLVGMQYRIDHLENLKADVFDLIAFPVQKVSGYVEDYEYAPGERIYVGDDGDVNFMSPPPLALNADIQITELERRMEELAGAPREAAGIRSPGEKTAFEVQTLDNAASRLFQNKILHFEKVFLEPLLNDMLAVAKQNMTATDIARSVSTEVDAVIFSTITKEDITADGTLRPRGASHFAERANQLQNIVTLLQSAAVQDDAVKNHLSGKRIAKLVEDLSNLDDFDIYGDNVRILELAESQQMAAAAGEEAEVAAATPPGIGEADFQGTQ